MCDIIDESITQTNRSPPESDQGSSKNENDDQGEILENRKEKESSSSALTTPRSPQSPQSPQSVLSSPLEVEKVTDEGEKISDSSVEKEKNDELRERDREEVEMEKIEISDGEVTDSSEKIEATRKERKKKRKRSQSPLRSRSRKRRRRARSSSSSSRGTFEGFVLPMPDEEELDDAPFKCDECGRGKLYTIKEVAEHEIRAHDARIPCMHCSKDSESVTKLASHMQNRHPNEPVTCHFCKQDFAKKISSASKDDWENFRKHVYQEVLKKKMYVHASKDSKDSDQVALRGVGRCPHGRPVKCKNFPNCPGDRCIYLHGLCRFDRACQKTACPFDHSNRPRTCMACLNDLKGGRLHGNRSRH
ncbi:unnamed protein product, partial [Mesorhabditis belari]|uniref:C2H2-type domain-containing protein n=1 Tax=Mesorhabditis belari TaxID=2138241 RepID=A0AAF3J218_9BILA